MAEADSGKKVDAFSLDAGVPKIEGSIRPNPKYADRISKRVIGVAVAIILLMVGIFFAALDAMDRKKKDHQETTEVDKKKPQPGKVADTVVPKDLTDAPMGDAAAGSTGAASLVGSAPKAQDDLLGSTTGSPSLTGGAAGGFTPAAPVGASGVPALKPGQGQGRGAASYAGAADNDLGSGTTMAPTPTPTPAPVTAEQQAEQIAKQNRLKRLEQARNNGLSAKNYSGDERKNGAGAMPAGLPSNLPAQLAGMSPAGAQSQMGQKSDSEQDEKLSFIKNAGKDDRSYLQHTQQPAVSPNELKRGSYLPLRLEGNVNSGQPGMVKARVTEDVYDTVTGCRLLVPALTMVQGVYDSKVAVGQTRNLVVWNYMGFEDGSELNLGAMQGYDSSGAAGIEADVDNHYMRLFGLTFGMSLITAGVQMSVPPTPTGTTAQTPQQSIANALTQQYGQLGAQLIGKYLQVQPTLRNYAGERFMIMLPLSIVFKKVWRNRCVGGV
ncbi:TrbI/VirB10 family protein [Cupriavidus necator]|uniref:TrbI/VirB10 family protein n=1 Tax=Cupriavidus necator TaxID=106590 RepID=UPI003ECE16DD